MAVGGAELRIFSPSFYTQRLFITRTHRALHTERKTDQHSAFHSDKRRRKDEGVNVDVQVRNKTTKDVEQVFTIYIHIRTQIHN